MYKIFANKFFRFIWSYQLAARPALRNWLSAFIGMTLEILTKRIFSTIAYKSHLKKLVLFFILYLPISVSAAPNATQQLIQILNNLHSMQAQFTQTVQDSHGQIMQQSSGDMALVRPGKFRWNTKNPSPQLLIADGQKIWFYDQELQQVTVQNQHAVHTSSPATLLDGSTSLTQDFIVNKVTNDNNFQIFKLTPRKKSSLFHEVYLRFKQNQLQQMRLIDNLEQETLINFFQVTINPILHNNIFHFNAPKDVDVIVQ